MSLSIASINSGSNANCYYIGNENDAILVDAGLSCRETEKRMLELGLSMQKVKAIFISHEHGDHISGVPALSKKYNLPVYITERTLKYSNIPIDDALINTFIAARPINLGSLKITPFYKQHDASDPHSFIISDGSINIGVITDIGYACKQVTEYFRKCHAVFLEANYCSHMLESGNYPYHLKQRISGNNGHLSNDQALELFRKHKSPDLKLLILSHLSKNNNNPAIVEKLFAPHAGHVQVYLASRYEASPVYTVNATARPVFVAKRKKITLNEAQLSLF